MILNPEPSVCVCILAHNEEKNIRRTLAAICSTKEAESLPIYVYANGCSDGTAKEVTRFAQTHRNVRLCELPIASKPLAWNAAFAAHRSEFIIFSDGDILVDSGAALQLVNELKSFPKAVIATCRQVAIDEGVTFQQKLVGFMHIPLLQNFLAGGFYAVRRQPLADLLEQKGFTALPEGVAGEDAFLDYLVGPERLIVSSACAAYLPPSLSDYCRYLARIQWQNEQIRHCWQNIAPEHGSLQRVVNKIRGIRSFRRLPVSLLALSAKHLYRLLFSSRIAKHYRNIGPLRVNGAEVLRDATRSLSTK
jgi:cellulose synthase/poly-beta-1,6-N-acetylglucosamine synthase-like glycosyltransferase